MSLSLDDSRLTVLSVVDFSPDTRLTLLFMVHFSVQELEKEGAKAISLQLDEPIKFHDENFTMGEY